jgi:hypothetical protein
MKPEGKCAITEKELNTLVCVVEEKLLWPMKLLNLAV